MSDLVIGILSANGNSPDVAACVAEGLRGFPDLTHTIVTTHTIPVQGLAEGFKSVYAAAQSSGARACGIVASDLTTVTPEWIARLVTPVLEGEYDLVAPCYVRHRFGGLVNRGILYPVVRALFGKRVRNPFGPDFGISSRLLERIVPGLAGRTHPVASLVPEAVSSGFPMCQSHLGSRVYVFPDSIQLREILAQALGPLFLEVEKRAVYWQRVRGSQPVPEFATAIYTAGDDAVPDSSRLIESFRLGTRNLEEIWGLVLPPSILVELRKMARAAPEEFIITDSHWARIVYDFALAHRLRAINRDHLLGAFTPLYLGWVASWANQTGDPEARVEQLCMAFEEERAYLVARWRWPDRFNA